MLDEAIQRAPQIVPAKGDPGKIHILHGLIYGKVFDGQIETQAPQKTYRFSYAPASASIIERRLVLSGRFALTAPPRGTRFLDGVQAKLVATQGGVGAPPARQPSRRTSAPATEGAAPEQKLEQEQGPETELQPGLHSFASPKYDQSGRPVVDSTGPLSFVGVLYFVLSPLDSRALDVPMDLSRVQLGGRLAPIDDLGRELQLVFSDLVSALHGERSDEQAANEMVARLNRIFTS